MGTPVLWKSREATPPLKVHTWKTQENGQTWVEKRNHVTPGKEAVASILKVQVHPMGTMTIFPVPEFLRRLPRGNFR